VQALTAERLLENLGVPVVGELNIEYAFPHDRMAMR
jgi:hypothetical protein